MVRGTIVVRAVWDSEAEVFVATSADVPGLVAEGATFQALQSKLDVLIPELLELNSLSVSDDEDDILYEEMAMVLMSEHMSKVKIRAHG